MESVYLAGPGLAGLGWAALLSIDTPDMPAKWTSMFCSPNDRQTGWQADDLADGLAAVYWPTE